MIDKYLQFLKEGILYNKGDLKNHKGIACVIWNKNKDKVLMQDHVKFNFWTLPVGKVDPGDSIDKTIKKEMKEELNINVSEYKLLFNWVGNYKREGKIVKVHAYDFEILKYSGTIKNNEPKKHRSIKWMTIQDIKKLKNISDNTKKFLKYHKG